MPCWLALGPLLPLPTAGDAGKPSWLSATDPVQGSHLIKEETEAQRREGASPRPHRELVAELDMESASPPESIVHYLF